MSIEFHILGPLEVVRDGRPLPLASRKRSLLLAALILARNSVVSADRLIDCLWGEQPPAGALKTLRAHISRLRGVLGEDVLRTVGAGYLLGTGSSEVDVDRLEELIAEGRRAAGDGSPQRASELLSAALELFRGPVLGDLGDAPFAHAEIARLDELRPAVIEERIAAELALGRAGNVIAEARAVLRQHPFRERLWGHLMVALYRSGRQAEALDTYREARRVLNEDLGLEPGPDLRAIETAILRQDPSLAGPPERAGEPEKTVVRKVVTVVCSGVAPPADAPVPLDPEALDGLQSRWYAMAAAVFRRHGGTVERPLGDLLIAIFGVPGLHEDDALRAVRGGWELQERAAALNAELERTWQLRLETRIGIASGEVAVGGPSTVYSSVVGGPTHTAARLQRLAEAGEVLLSDATYRLVSAAVEATEVGPGNARRLTALISGAPTFERRLDAPFVGRQRELAQLDQAFERVTQEQTAFLFTVMGSAGIGKTRLVLEFVRRLNSRVLTGRCQHYGEGITYWPLREVVHEALGDDGLRTFMAGDADGPLVRARLAAALGLSNDPVSTEEVFWAVRKALEALAPVVVVLEDIHWAEPTLLDLVEHVAESVPASPVMLLCVARPELLETRPAWGGGQLNSASVLLERLSDRDAATLLRHLAHGVDERRLAQILLTAEGNPLFIEQLLASVNDPGANGQELPPTIQALLAARIDHLPAPERTVLARASVVGREFAATALADLVPAELRPALPAHLDALVRKQFLRPRPGAERPYRFRHVLIQTTTYATVSKHERADLHERFAAWLEGGLGGADEVLGYHREQACRYRWQLGLRDRRTEQLARRAAQHLAAEGQRAVAHGDAAAAVNLFTRAIGLRTDFNEGTDVNENEAAAVLRLGRGRAHGQLGSVDEARADFDATLRAARRTGEKVLEMRALNELGFLTAGTSDYRQAVPLLEASLALAEALDDREGAVTALARLSIVDTNRLRLDLAIERGDRALSLARRGGDRHLVALALDALHLASVMTGDPAAIARIGDELVELHRSRGDLWYLQSALYQRSYAALLSGRWDDAAAQVHEAWTVNRDIRDRGNEAVYPATLCWIERCRGNYRRALDLGRQGLTLAHDANHAEFIALSAGLLGWTLVDVFAFDAAADLLTRALDAAERADARIELPRALCNLALVRHAQGDPPAARHLARRAEDLLAEIRVPRGGACSHTADATIALARVYGWLGDPERAGALLTPLLDAAISAGWREVIAEGSLALAEVHPDGGEALVRRALEVATRWAMPGPAWRAHAALATLDRDRADLHRAAARWTIAELADQLDDPAMRATFLDRAG